MRLNVFRGLRPLKGAMALRDVVAGVVLASMNIPQVLGYTRIAGTPTITGLYTVLLPVVGFSVFGLIVNPRNGKLTQTSLGFRGDSLARHR
jgi:sulfate permease, SulP family